jgi:large-conductance mechanosensitive channel
MPSPLHDFLVNTNVAGIVIGFMVSSQAIAFTNEFLASFVSPVISYMFDKTNSPIEDKTVRVFDIEFKLARFIVAFIRLIVVLCLVYMVFKMSPLPVGPVNTTSVNS